MHKLENKSCIKKRCQSKSIGSSLSKLIWVCLHFVPTSQNIACSKLWWQHSCRDQITGEHSSCFRLRFWPVVRSYGLPLLAVRIITQTPPTWSWTLRPEPSFSMKRSWNQTCSFYQIFCSLVKLTRTETQTQTLETAKWSAVRLWTRN